MVVRGPTHETSTVDLLDRILDKGIVIDVWARAAVAGVDLGITVKARMVVASIDTHLKYKDQLNTRGQLDRSGKSE